MQVEVTEEQFQDHADLDNGICLTCGEWTTGGVEPDAEGYICEHCETPNVMGAEQALITGHIHFIELPEKEAI